MNIIIILEKSVAVRFEAFESKLNLLFQTVVIDMVKVNRDHT